jgi:flagellar basal-body rod modification protein FlgD
MTTLADLTTINQVTGAPPPAVRKTASTLGVQDFLTLMTTQLKNQDPLKPLDSTEFVAQLAQFGTVSGIQGMESSLTSLSSALRSSQVLSGANLVGHQVLTAGGTAQYSGVGAVNGSIDVPSGSNGVTLSVTDASGQVVRHINIDTATGSQAFSWDGKSDSGAQLAAGSYTVNAIASSNGTNTSLPTYLYGRVSSVSLDATGTELTVNTPELGAIALSSVRQIT